MWCGAGAWPCQRRIGNGVGHAPYLVEQTFAEQLNVQANEAGAQWIQTILGNDALDGVTWIHSYVSADRRRTYCICDAPSPEAVRRAAQRNGLPVDRITEVRMLDPYFLH